MSKGKLVPKLRFQGFKSKWQPLKLGELAELFNGYSFKSQDSTEEGIRWLKIANVGVGYIKWKDKSYLPNDFKEEYKKYLLFEEDLVIALTRPILNNKIKLASIERKDAPALLNQRIGKVIPIDKKSDNLFLKYLISHRENVSKIESSILGTEPPNISKDTFERIIVSTPSLKEQKKVGSFFRKIDQMIQLQKSKVNKVKDIKSAYLSEMFPKEGEKYPKKRFEGFTEPWEEYKLKDMGRSLTGLSGKSKKDFGHGEAEFVTYMNVFNNPIAKSTQTAQVEVDENQTEVEYGDIFFTVSSETPNEVGMSSVWLYNRPNVYLNSFCFGFRPTINLNPYYMAYMLRSPEIRKRFILLAQGISRYNISKTKAMELLFPIPSNEEQEKIGQFFKNLDNQISIEEEKLAKLEKLKQAYLNDMFI